jgi:streptogramin lyase
VSATIPVTSKNTADEPGVFGVASGFGSIWATDWVDGELVRIDPVTNAIVARIPVGPKNGPTLIATGAGAVWVAHADSENRVYRVDPATNQVSAIELGTLHPHEMFLEVASDKLWVRATDDSIVRYDPATGRVTSRLKVASGRGFTVAFGSLWASVVADAAPSTASLWRIPVR